MKRASRDLNHGEVIDALRGHGIGYIETYLAPDAIDLFTYMPGEDKFRGLEIKNPETVKILGKGAISKGHQKLIGEGCPIIIVTSGREAVEAHGIVYDESRCSPKYRSKPSPIASTTT